MSTEQERQFTFRDALRVLFRHKWKGAGFFVLAVAATLAGVCFAPRSYVSEARIFVRVGRESLTLDPTATTGQNISLYESRENEINSVMEILKSRSLSERVVDELGIEVVLSKDPPGGESGVAGGELPPLEIPAWLTDAVSVAGTWLGPDRPLSRREQAVQLIEESVDIWAARKSSVINIRGKAVSPELAQKIVARLLEVSLEEHVRVHRTEGSYAFFREQSDLLLRQLEEAQVELRDAKNAIGVGSIEYRLSTVQSHIGQTEAELFNAERERASAKARVDELSDRIAGLPERITTQEVTGHPNVAADSMRQILYGLQLRERELASKYTDEHPAVVAIRQQAREAEEIVARQEPRRTQTASDLNPARQKLVLDLLGERAYLAAVEARAASLAGQHASLRRELAGLNDSHIRLAQLERKARLAEESYRAYEQSFEQARIDQALENERISNVNVVQPASFVEKPAFPPKRLAVALGLFVAVVGSIGLAAACEYFDQTLKTPEDVRESLGIPVLMSLPRTRRHGVMLH
jgi:uncharacterized protein involved in exopolysaccharide biosynthesis